MPVFVFDLHTEAIQKFKISNAGLFPNFTSSGLLFIFASLNVTLWKVPVAGGVMQSQVFWLGIVFYIKYHCTSRSLLYQWSVIDLAVCKFFALSFFAIVILFYRWLFLLVLQ